MFNLETAKKQNSNFSQIVLDIIFSSQWNCSAELDFYINRDWFDINWDWVASTFLPISQKEKRTCITSKTFFPGQRLKKGLVTFGILSPAMSIDPGDQTPFMSTQSTDSIYWLLPLIYFFWASVVDSCWGPPAQLS